MKNTKKDKKQLKIIGEGGYRLHSKMLVFDTENGEIEIDTESAKEITLTFFDSLDCTSKQYDEIANMIDDLIYERDGE